MEITKEQLIKKLENFSDGAKIQFKRSNEDRDYVFLDFYKVEYNNNSGIIEIIFDY